MPRSPVGLSAEVAQVGVLLLLALIGPVLAGLAVRWRSIARDRGPGAWFARAHTLNLIMMAGWVLWLIVAEATRASELAALAASGSASLRMILSPLAWIGYLPAAFALTAISRDVVRRLRGRDPLPRGAGPAQVRLLAALSLVFIALAALTSDHLRAGVFLLLGAIAALVLLPGSRGPLGMTPQALSSGALRDRLFEMARRARVRVRELYVVPMRRERLANAFAVHGGMVMVADELLDRMSRREVDATLAHELSHLGRHHPIRTLLVSAGACCLVMTAGLLLGLDYTLPASIVAAWLTGLFVARRCEFAADAGAAALTGDAEAVVSFLGNLARINDVPLAWGRGRGWLITHPSTEARALAVGRRAGLAPERVRELLARGLPPGERYGRAERPGEESRVFSTAWKTAVIGRLSLALLVTAVAAPAAASAIARALGVAPPHAIAILAGGALGLGALLFVHDRFAARLVSGLEAPLRRRLEDDPGGAPSLYVALSPGDRARVYEGFLDWDLGLLSIGPDRLRYRGEQVTLDLPRRALRAIEIGAAAPGWIRTPRVVLRWKAPEGEACLTLRMADASRVSEIRGTTRSLAQRLVEWRAAAAAAGTRWAAGESAGGAGHGAAAPIGSDESPPGIGAVTSLTPAEAAAPRDLPVLLVLVGLLSAAASFVTGLDVWSGLDLFGAALLALLALRWPAMASREAPPAERPEPVAERRAA